MRSRASTMTTMQVDATSDDHAPGDQDLLRAEQRLHPMSWLFVLVQSLRQFIVPLVALVFFGEGDREALFPLIGVGVLMLVSVWQYATYRYGIGSDRLVVRSGLLERGQRVIPFARIHNVTVQQNALHRVFGVAEVRLESAGGTTPEAQMRVLRLADAIALEALVRHRGVAAVDAGIADAQADAATPLLHLPLGELLRLGIVSNRGMLVVGAGAAALSQFRPRIWSKGLEQAGGQAFGWAREHSASTFDFALLGLAVFAFLAVLMRALSIVLALLQYHGFTLRERGPRLTVERGLLSRVRASVARRRIQAWTLREGVLHRLLGRRSLEVDTAGAVASAQNPRTFRELAPIASPAACDALIAHLLPSADWPHLPWIPLSRRNAWRLFVPGLLWNLVITGALVVRFGAWGLLALAWLPVSAYAAWRSIGCMAYAVDDVLVAVRDGWWSRTWRFAEIDKLQVLQQVRSPVDRMFGTATLVFDTPGASVVGGPLRIRFMPGDAADAVMARLKGALSRRPWRG